MMPFLSLQPQFSFLQAMLLLRGSIVEEVKEETKGRVWDCPKSKVGCKGALSLEKKARSPFSPSKKPRLAFSSVLNYCAECVFCLCVCAAHTPHTNKTAKNRHRACALGASRRLCSHRVQWQCSFWSCAMNASATETLEQRTVLRGGLALSKSLPLPDPARTAVCH